MTSGTFLTISRMTSRAPGTVIVTSMIGLPPWATSSTAKRASSADEVLIEGTRPTSSTRFRRSSLFMAEALPQGPAGRNSRRLDRSDFLHSIIVPAIQISSDRRRYAPGVGGGRLRREAAQKHVSQKKKSRKVQDGKGF